MPLGTVSCMWVLYTFWDLDTMEGLRPGDSFANSMLEKSPSSSFGLHSLYLFSLSVLLPLYVPGPLYVPALFVYTHIVCMYLCHLYISAFLVCITCMYLYPLYYLYHLSVLASSVCPAPFICTCIICMYLFPLHVSVSFVCTCFLCMQLYHLSWFLPFGMNVQHSF